MHFLIIINLDYFLLVNLYICSIFISVFNPLYFFKKIFNSIKLFFLFYYYHSTLIYLSVIKSNYLFIHHIYYLIRLINYYLIAWNLIKNQISPVLTHAKMILVIYLSYFCLLLLLLQLLLLLLSLLNNLSSFSFSSLKNKLIND